MKWSVGSFSYQVRWAVAIDQCSPCLGDRLRDVRWALRCWDRKHPELRREALVVWKSRKEHGKSRKSLESPGPGMGHPVLTNESQNLIREPPYQNNPLYKIWNKPDNFASKISFILIKGGGVMLATHLSLYLTNESRIR